MNENEAKCEGCSKEKYDRVPTMRVISKLDECFSRNDLDGARRLLCYWENEARIIGDRRGLLEILNEQIGLYRRIGDSENGISAADEAVTIIDTEGIDGTVSAATILINAATTLKAFGHVSDALPHYEKALTVYLENGVNDLRLAALYNNMASAKAEVRDCVSAEGCYLKAVEILKGINVALPEIAVSYINLAHLYYEQFAEDERIPTLIDGAYEILENGNTPRDANYAFVCSKCAPSFGFFGYFLREKELKERARKIYEGS